LAPQQARDEMVVVMVTHLCSFSSTGWQAQEHIY